MGDVNLPVLDWEESLWLVCGKRRGPQQTLKHSYLAERTLSCNSRKEGLLGRKKIRDSGTQARNL